jgi:predicted GNAT family N-acyltransferase
MPVRWRTESPGMITYKKITTADPEYESEKDLRHRALRVPLGLTLSYADVRGEDAQIHLAAMDDAGAVVGCVLLVIPGDGTAHVRQMAVDECCRGSGIGAGLMAQAENTAQAMHLSKVTLHARVYARGFYERLGYHAVGEEFTEVTIPHIAMEKTLPGKGDKDG